MVHAYDTWGVLPTMDIYDTGMMRAAVAVAKDMYDRGEQRIKDFNTAYGDFITPIQADQDWYNLNVTGRVRDTINNLYARGIDPLRSAEGRAIVALMVNNIPVGQVAKLRSSAKAAEEYIKNRGLLEAAGKYNSDLEERFLGYNLANWDTLGSGLVWNRTSPTEMKTLKELTESWYNNRTARDLTEADLKAAGIPYDKRYQYSGYLDSDILNVARGNTPGWNDSVYSRYYRDLAERQVAASGLPYTKQDVEARLLRNIADAQQEWLINPSKKADEFALDDYRTANDIRAHRAKAAIDYEYKHKDDPNPTGTEDGYSLLKDVYVTTLAKGAGLEYLPQGGVNVNLLPQLLKAAEKRQRTAIASGKNVLDATGQFISPDKINGIIPSAGKSGRGHFLSPEAIKMLCTEDAVRTSFKGWSQKGNPSNSGAVKTYRNNMSKEIANALSNANGKKGFYVKAVPVVDKNGNNIYPMVGDDNRWHTYARLKIYLSDGTKTTSLTLVESKKGVKEVKMEKDGIELLLPVGLLSNEEKASPDLSISEREKVGIGPYKVVKSWVGEDQDADFPWGTNLIKNETSLQ